jgi:ammonia channel protein AmtB
MGLFFSGSWFFGRELTAFAAAFAFAVTYLISLGIDQLMEVRVPKEVEVTGLGTELHGEVVYGQ